MPYVGNKPEVGNFRKCDAITTSATATYNLLVGGVAVNPNQNQCIVSLNGVIQSSGTSYTIASSQITFASALTSSDVIDFILILGDTLDVGVPSDDAVGLAQLSATGSPSSSNFLRGDNSWAAAGFDVTSITGATALAEQPASTDEIVLSDAGTLKRLDIKHISNTPAFAVYKSADQSISDGTHTKVAFNTEVYDTDSTYDNSSNYRFTPAVAGKYFLTSSIAARQSNDEAKMHNLIVSFYKNGSQVSSSNSFTQSSTTFSVTHTDTIDLDDDDYVEVFAFAQVQTETPVLEATTTSDGSRALGRALTFSGFRITGV
tara:strand:- start:1161 stop:2111 length:951 start_codon:yes stop_codon:yes gene_type:complete